VTVTIEYLRNDTRKSHIVTIHSGGSGFFILGATGVATLSSGGHTTNTFALNYRLCNQRCFPIRSFITLAENFGKWRPYLTFWGRETQGARNFTGGAHPDPRWNRP